MTGDWQEVVILALRLAFIATLYLFLLAVVALIWRDLRATARSRGEGKWKGGRLIVVEGGTAGLRPGETLPLYPHTSLGRDLTNTVVLDDAFASGEHALLTYRAGRWWLEDLGSTNGTTLNDVPIDRAVVVSVGGIIGIGGVRLKLDRE